ncbi:CRISPR-associated protein, Csh2 family [Desulforamulus putei DSM 12395]|uniref:CRISPR-associated protein, Csh2 family n=1 Tax=Desulforamulus putei DSM 12395 TaxID=1121429 RepID=A0A1M5AHG4_9FIRM|nr:type I-B CRISPR-associated protein Cas7/Csh2 [Desulforamulus putei]SHF29587.1 CRISPR-associated protein, Csh2 family [Desulforamulus putei DSM 12395]
MLNNRSEILFLYDCTFSNPNGDPLDANKPRIDEESGKNIVTDVRLKRTVRDFLNKNKGEEIFVREIADEEGIIQDAKLRAEDFLNQDGKTIKKSDLKISEMKSIIEKNILDSCIDVRLFGATIPIEKNTKEKSSITLTGPVQFKMGQSLHRVKLQYIKGTGAFASGSDQTRKTFREEYILPYSLIAFYGVVNENAAIHTKLTEDDVNKLLDALWNGTKNLLSRSKAGQQPRLLLRVSYQESCFHLGELDKLVFFNTDKYEEEIRDIQDGILNVDKLVEALAKNKDKIAFVEVAADDRLRLSQNLQETLSKLSMDVRTLSF